MNIIIESPRRNNRFQNSCPVFPEKKGLFEEKNIKRTWSSQNENAFNISEQFLKD